MKRIVGSCLATLVLAFLAIHLGCQPTYDKERDHLARMVKGAIDPVTLQKWAETVLATMTNGQEILVADIPKELLHMGRGQPNANVWTESENGKKCVELSWGNGFGHQGLIIGDKNFRKNLVNENLSLAEWIPGIYFFGQKH